MMDLKLNEKAYLCRLGQDWTQQYFAMLLNMNIVLYRFFENGHIELRKDSTFMCKRIIEIELYIKKYPVDYECPYIKLELYIFRNKIKSNEIFKKLGITQFDRVILQKKGELNHEKIKTIFDKTNGFVDFNQLG